MKNDVKIEFNANNYNVTFARGAVAALLLNLDLTLNTINEVKTIVSEAVTNAIVHGYQNDDSKKVYLTFSVDENQLIIIVQDFGKGIENIEKAKEPLFSTKLKEERAGLGFTIMDIFSDEMIVTSKVDEGTTVKCIKYLEK